MKTLNLPDQHPAGIAMWDFSWLERRWPNAGYEDYGQALRELKERGYSWVRIDAFPHLLSVDPNKEFHLHPCRMPSLWGSPDPVSVTVAPALLQFLRHAREQGIKVGLSSWFRADTGNHRMRICTPKDLADAWIKTLDYIADADLMDVIGYLDLCNEWPAFNWAPFLWGGKKPVNEGCWAAGEVERFSSPLSIDWMSESIRRVKTHYPEMPCTFSISFHHAVPQETPKDALAAFDFIDAHLWITSGNPLENEFMLRLADNRPDVREGDLALMSGAARDLYYVNPDYWHAKLREQITIYERWSLETDLPLIQTEGWACTFYRDGPGYNWDWIKDVAAFCIAEAAKSKRWAALCTSNFCGPQFPGMWRDIDWHRAQFIQ